MTAEVIERATNLKVVGRAGVGVDNVDVEAATRRGIVVANAPESNVVSAAEHTIGLLVALARNIPQAHAALMQGRWERSRWGGVELADKTLGVLGFGRIGRQVARRAQGLGMKVLAYDPFVVADRFREAGVEGGTLDEVLARSDFLTLHLPLTADTRGSIDDAAIAKMRDGVRIVNAARGDLIDDAALIRALESGKVAGAALDVFVEEPYSGPLLTAPNVVLTPHLAASTEEAQDRAGLIVAEQVVAALQGGLVTYAVNIPTIGAEDLEVLGPFVPLAAKLGRLAMELAAGEVSRIRLDYSGDLSAYDTRLLTVAALNGAFEGRTDQPVNYVNAPLIAAERGVEVVEGKRSSSRDYRNLVQVAADGATVAGTTIGSENRQWLVEALGYQLEIELGADDGAAALRRRAGRDRPHRHALRGRGREHRQHGGVANPRGRQGADGAQPRLAGSGRARPRAARDERHRLRRAVIERWPEPVERVAEVLSHSRRRGTDRRAAARHADGAGRGRRARVRARRDREVGRHGLRRRVRRGARPGRPARRRDSGGRRCRCAGGPARAARGGRRGDRLRARRRRAVSAPLRRRGAARQVAARTSGRLDRRRHADHMAALTSVDLQRLAKARPVDLTTPS